MDFQIESLVPLATQWSLRVVGAVAVLVLGRWIASKVDRGLRSRLTGAGMEPMLIPFTASMVYWGIMAFVGVAVLGLFGVPTASFVAVLGAVGLAVGLALQGTLGNFAAGVIILTLRPFRVGEFVEIAGVSGTVEEVGLFWTGLNTPDNLRLTIPNSDISGQIIKNFSFNPTRRIDLVMSVAYDDDLDVARSAIESALAADDRILAEPAPMVAVHQLADSSVNFVVRPWCKREDYWAVRFDLTKSLKLALEEAGCSIPFPQRDVHLHQVA